MIRNFFSRLLYGRYGSDALGLFLVSAGLVLWLISQFVPIAWLSTVLWAIGYAAMLWSIFRMFSRNYAARRRENDRFTALIEPLMQGFRRTRNQMRDRDHVYFRCPNCGARLRVPKGKNRISVTCRSCGHVFQKKT